VKSLKTIVFGTYAFGWLVAAFTLLPIALATGFWLLGLPMDWSSWRTYAGLEVVALAMTFLTR
jgi:hypothetical protein